MKKSRFESLREKMNERNHRSEFMDEFREAPNKWRFLVEHPSIFNTIGGTTVPSNLTQFPNVFLFNATATATMVAANQSASSNITVGNLVVPYIVTFSADTFGNLVLFGIASSTINLSGGAGTNFGGASYGLDYFGININQGGGVGAAIFENQNGVETQNNVNINGGANAPTAANTRVTFREYSPGALQWIVTTPTGGALANFPTTYSNVTSPWVNPNTTSRATVVGCVNLTVTFTLVQTPANLL